MHDSNEEKIRKIGNAIIHLERTLNIADEDEIEDIEREIRDLELEIMLLEQEEEE